MSNRLEEQELILSAITSGSFSPHLLENILPAGKLTQIKALDTYHNDYIARLTHALGDFYEATWMVLGDQRFFEVCREYIDKNPSQSKDLGQYGSDFPKFVKTIPEAQEFNFLSSLAQLEKDFLVLFHKSAQASLSIEEIQRAIVDENLKAPLSKDIHLYNGRSPLYEIFEKRKNPEKEINWDNKSPFMLYVHTEAVRIRYLSEFEFKAIKFMSQGQTISMALEKASYVADDVKETDISGLIQFVVQEGLFVKEQ